VSTAYGTVADLFETLVVVTVGSLLVFFGVAGALAQSIRGAGTRSAVAESR